LPVTGSGIASGFSMRTNVLYDIQRAADLPADAWSNVAPSLTITNGPIAPVVVGAAGDLRQFCRSELHC
jgi:hypothetical protein